MNRKNLDQYQSRYSRDSQKRKSIFDPQVSNSPSRPQFQKLYSNNREVPRSSVDHTIVKEKACPTSVFVVLGFLALAGLITLFVFGLLNYSGPGNLQLQSQSDKKVNTDLEDGISEENAAKVTPDSSEGSSESQNNSVSPEAEATSAESQQNTNSSAVEQATPAETQDSKENSNPVEGEAETSTPVESEQHEAITSPEN